VAVAQPPAGWAVSIGAALYPAWVELRDSTVDARRGQLEQVAQRACEDLATVGLQATSELREGDAAEELLHAASEDGADLIVVGSRGLSALTRLALGSVARKVLLHTRASVLVVREPREKVKAAEPISVRARAAAGAA